MPHAQVRRSRNTRDIFRCRQASPLETPSVSTTSRTVAVLQLTRFQSIPLAGQSMNAGIPRIFLAFRVVDLLTPRSLANLLSDTCPSGCSSHAIPLLATSRRCPLFFGFLTTGGMPRLLRAATTEEIDMPNCSASSRSGTTPNGRSFHAVPSGRLRDLYAPVANDSAHGGGAIPSRIRSRCTTSLQMPRLSAMAASVLTPSGCPIRSILRGMTGIIRFTRCTRTECGVTPSSAAITESLLAPRSTRSQSIHSERGMPPGFLRATGASHPEGCRSRPSAVRSSSRAVDADPTS